MACLPRGLESCRYGGAVGVTFSELGPDSSGDRSSMPSEAMSLTVRNDGVAPGCTEFSLSTEEQPAAGCWCRLAPVQQQLTEAWRGEELRGGPRPSQIWPRAWAEFMLVHTEGIFFIFS